MGDPDPELADSCGLLGERFKGLKFSGLKNCECLGDIGVFPFMKADSVWVISLQVLWINEDSTLWILIRILSSLPSKKSITSRRMRSRRR